MAKNTNNSLSDLNNEGQKFNRPLTSNEIENNNVDDDKKIEELRKRRSSAPTPQRKEALDNNIAKTEQHKRNALTNPPVGGNDDMSSLFQRNASIDYGRYINADGSVQKNWENFNTKDGDNFEINSKITSKNTPVFYNDGSLESDEGLSLPNLIKWSEDYPALQLKFQDFAYCKKLGYYPNNRLIILRRFKAGVPDNLFDYVNESSKIEYNQPLSTMITWWNPEEEIGDMNMSFSESWTEYKSGLMQTFKESLNDFDNGVFIKKDEGEGKVQAVSESGYNDLVTALAFDTFISDKDYKKEDGVPYTRSNTGNPNLIKSAKVRTTGGGGLKSNIEFSIDFEYEMRDINNIDPGIAMLDLISNCTRMGTSVSEFKYNIPALKNSVGVKALINGDINKALEVFKTSISDLTDTIKGGFDNITNLLGDNDLDKTKSKKDIDEKKDDNIVTKGVKYIISRYRENLKTALSVDTGLPSGIWHVTIGNPKAPIISCGDLIIRSSKLKLGKELGYNDFPNEFKVSYNLESARERGRDELNRIFNAGRGRVYVYPNAIANPDYDLYSNGNSNPDTKN
jgi:hypothetical protein